MKNFKNNHLIGIVGLGKMGGGIALQLNDKKWNVHVYNRTVSVTKSYEKQGLKGYYSLKEFVDSLDTPRIVWVMLTAGDPTDQILLGEDGLINLLDKGDIIIDAANSFFKDTERRYKALKEKGIRLLDAGVSGGPKGARNGACIMIGGERDVFEYVEPIFRDLSVKDGYRYFGDSGSGHFVKMVHNGIEYGMMQAIGEGFAVMKKSKYNLNLEEVAEVYNHKSVIESRLIGWLIDGYKKYGENLDEISGSVAQSGEGLWTYNTAKEMKINIPVIEESVKFRSESQRKPSYIGKVVSVLRNMFGGHDVFGN